MPHSEESATVRGATAASLALTLVGSQVAAADLIEDYPVPTGQALRYAVAAAVLLAIARARLPRLSRREALGLAALSATGLVLFNTFVLGAVREGDPATVGVIIGCVPVVLAIAGPLLDGRRPSGRVVVAALVVAAGAAGVQYAGGGLSALGLLLALGALAGEACFSLLAMPHLERLGPLAVSAYACLFAVPMLALWSLLAHGPAPEAPTGEEAATLLYVAVVVTVGGFLLWYTAVGLLGVERAGLFAGVLPVSALVCSAAIGAAEVTPARLAAVAVVAAGVSVGVRSPAGPRVSSAACSSTPSSGSVTRASV